MDYHDIILKYSDLKPSNSSFKNSKTIWIFWWQGVEEAPDLVKTCIENIKKFNDNVIIIDQNNVFKYTDIPDYIFEKLSKNIITLTQFSDILRFNLLKLHGGIWMDSTIFSVENIPSNYFDSNYYTSGPYKEKDNFFISNGKWTGFFMGGHKNQIMFNFINELFFTYWKNENYLIDYFLIDYFLNIAYENNIGGFKEYIENKTVSNPDLFKLQPLLNKKYNKKIYNEISRDTKFFKLSYKKNFKKNSENTFYYFLILKFRKEKYKK